MTTQDTMDPKAESLGEDSMVSKARWEEIRRLAAAGETVSAIGRQLDLDRKTVRALVHKTTWQPYRRAPKEVQRLTAHLAFLRDRAPAVEYSAQILYQELRQQHAYRGSYATVRRLVRPLREAACRADLTWTRFETAPGQQSQIDRRKPSNFDDWPREMRTTIGPPRGSRAGLAASSPAYAAQPQRLCPRLTEAATIQSARRSSSS
jgi:hypothetical protein